VLIALLVHDNIIRPYFGDLLVVILIYCLLKSFLNTPPFITAIAVLLFAFTVEFLQYLRLIHLLGLENSAAARIILGSSFEWLDLLAYTVGVVILLIVERMICMKKRSVM
jgi:hypothetical protein